MIIKKLAVPLINDKILQQAEHCYIATAGISEVAFDFIKNRLSPKCKIDIVTGLDSLTSPQVLRRIWRHYQDRITLRLYTRNTFHANVYIFDLPFRKAVAFTGSGEFTMEGLKDHEEIFKKIIDPKEIEALLSWYTSYYEFGETLTENMIQEYELIYPALKQREIASRAEKKLFTELTTAGFNWDYFKFKNQYFKKEDYLVFGNAKVTLQTDAVHAERLAVKNKFLQLHESLQKYISGLKLQENTNAEAIVSSSDISYHTANKIQSMWLAYGRRAAELKKYSDDALFANFMSMQVIILPKNVGFWLVPGKAGTGKKDREFFQRQMLDAAYRATFFRLLSSLGAGYWIEIVGERKPVESFQNEEVLWEFTKADQWPYFDFIIGKNYSPGDVEISNDNITSTITKEFDKLILLYRHMKDNSMDNK